MVSVIIPTYNYAQFLPHTLKSLLAQSYCDFECIIIDNGSTDNTFEIIQPFLKDKRFIYSKQQNLGVSAARNLGIKEAKGDFILFLDADDLIEVNKLEASVKYLNNHVECDLVYSDMRYFKTEIPHELYFSFACNKNNDSPWMNKIEGKGKDLVSVLLKGNIMVISSPIFRKNVLSQIGIFDERIQYNEDWDLWFRMVLNNKRINYLELPETKALIRVHKTSASVNVFRMQVCGLFVLLKNSDEIKSFGLNVELKNRITTHKSAIIRSLSKMPLDKFKEALKFIENLNLTEQVIYHKIYNFRIARLFFKLKSIVGI